MKRALSILLAVLMLALPAFSMAEGIPGFGGASVPDLAKKYTDAGQKSTVTITFEPGDLLPALVGDEDTGAAVTDLLKILGIKIDGQSGDDAAQTAVTLQLDGEDALALTFATATDGIYAKSSLTGEDVFAISPEELKTLLETLAKQAESNGTIPEGALSGFLADPSSAIAGMANVQLDTTGLQNALMPILMGAKNEEVTEAPEAFPEAKTVTTIRITKEDMNNVLTEVARLVWQVPAAQQLLGMTAGGGEPMTEENLIQMLTAYPSVMKDDAVLQIYSGDSGDRGYVTFESVMRGEDDSEVIVRNETLSTQADGTSSLNSQTKITSTNTSEVVGVSLEITSSERKTDFHMAMTDDLEGDVATMMEILLSAETAVSETEVTTLAEGVVRFAPDRGSKPVGLFFSENTAMKDLGDHAEGQGSMTVGLEDAGSLMTVKVTTATAAADALIVTPDAIHPMAMNEEELNSLGTKLMGSVMGEAAALLQKLPANFLQMVTGAPVQ